MANRDEQELLAPSRTKYSPGGLWCLPATAMTPRAWIQSMTLEQPQPGTYLSSSWLLGSWQEPASKNQQAPQRQRHRSLHKEAESKGHFLTTPSGEGFLQHSLQRCNQCAKAEVLACLQSLPLPQEHSCESLPQALGRATQASHHQAASPTAPAPGGRQQEEVQCLRRSYCVTPNSSDLFNILYFYWLPISL